MSDQPSHRVAVIGGDGIGPEVTAAALEVIAASGVALEVTEFDLGAARYLRDGFVLDDATLEELRGYDAILLGAIGPAIGDTRIAGGVLERGLLLRMRFGLDLYINYRPFRGVEGSLAEGCEFAIVRENTEGPYAGEGGVLRYGTPQEVATQGSVNTRFGVERCVRYAFARANQRERKKLDAGPQDQRLDLRRRSLATGRGRGRRRVPRGGGRLPARGRGVHLLGRAPRGATGSSSPTISSVTSSRTWRAR